MRCAEFRSDPRCNAMRPGLCWNPAQNLRKPGRGFCRDKHYKHGDAIDGTSNVIIAGERYLCQGT